jgi:UDP-N-acetylmuramyl tripeptide synthase
VRIVLDRAAAIEQAISEARAGDVVAVLGLGALDRLTLDANGAVTPHRDADAARSALGRRTELASCA